jgi:hypothetical protein
MQSPVTIAFFRLERTGDLEAYARALGLRLKELGERVSGCHITLQGRPSHADLRYVAKIELRFPSAQIFADSLCANPAGHVDIYLALEEAYKNAARQLRGFHLARPSMVESRGGTTEPERAPLAGV